MKIEELSPPEAEGQKGPNSNEEWGPGEGIISRPFLVMEMTEKKCEEQESLSSFKLIARLCRFR